MHRIHINTPQFSKYSTTELSEFCSHALNGCRSQMIEVSGVVGTKENAIILVIEKAFYKNAMSNPDGMGQNRKEAAESLSNFFQSVVYALGFDVGTIILSERDGNGRIGTFSTTVTGKLEPGRLALSACRFIGIESMPEVERISVLHTVGIDDICDDNDKTKL